MNRFYEIFLGFDFGYKRIGLAVGQRVTFSANPLPALQSINGMPDWSSIEKIIGIWNPNALILGLPICTNNKEQPITVATRIFANQLKNRFLKSVYFIDERLSTVEARDKLFKIGGYRKIISSSIDSFSACIFLEDWLRKY
ncbi:Holliday junction resolvase RuvX [Candidatus Legionella polyplacis]|uniref:Holliday junction resolvase RuvX n=1 Tax=Candidatus Legionella polyplacis TaxID=2005262 RepID=UPI000C1F6451|nr:Holliday junction resolvase RuvX [Candidatus Legionella polyplacis]ATW02093.1 Holliday junction resolvase RuvX [Candidatus Legionella polyplacis]